MCFFVVEQKTTNVPATKSVTTSVALTLAQLRVVLTLNVTCVIT